MDIFSIGYNPYCYYTSAICGHNFPIEYTLPLVKIMSSSIIYSVYISIIAIKALVAAYGQIGVLLVNVP